MSGVATGGQGGQSAPPDSENFAKNQGKEGEIGKNREKEENREEKAKSGRFFFFTLPLLTDRAGYATGDNPKRGS